MRIWQSLFGVLFAVSLSGGLAAAAPVEAVRTIALPPELNYPEGIGYDPAGYIYTAGAADGAVIRTDLKSLRSTVIIKANSLLPAGNTLFPAMLGMKVDGAKRLWLTGGRTGRIFVVDTASGKLLKDMKVPGQGSLLNDAVVTANAVFVTDTLRPVLWRIPVNGRDIGEPEAWLDFTGTPLRYGEGPNLNGIARNAAGTALVVIQMNKGLLFKIDLATRAVTPIDIGSEVLTGGDGLEMDADRLYLVRQPEAEVVTLQLSPDWRSGKVTSRFKHAALLWPATAAKVGNELLIVNSQFNRRNSPEVVRPFSVAAVPLSVLNGK